MKYNRFVFGLMFFLVGCGSYEPYLHTEVITNICIKPMIEYHYQTCKPMRFIVNRQEYEIPSNFQTDLASIPKIVWPIMAPAHSSLIRPAIIHDWLYRKTCEFTRLQTDLIFYHMLKNDGVSTFRASTMYYAVRFFGWNYYNEDYCDDEFKGLDKTPRKLQVAALYGHYEQGNDRMGT